MRISLMVIKIIKTGFRIRIRIVFLEENIQYTLKKGLRYFDPETECRLPNYHWPGTI
jgi:hypothetical protein